ncbi:MAG: dNTP triphosphohydrolase [Alphaproteobacteria bacterium]|nr:dNTP triphosphohydrolase [Alphaproteobacteria bacterium]
MAETNPASAGRLLGPVVSPPGPRAPFAARPETSRGRLYPESESATRSCYSRDRDRIIHSSAFRRLKHKTQVFVQHEGDYYRTRLTHSLEVAQLARSLARSLAADEDLAETVALAHDLGHTPFGHAGEEALDAATRDIGGFDHNAHTLRLVTRLEHRYADFDGLNLTWETLEGLVKHNGPLLINDPLRFQLSLGSPGSPSHAETTSPSRASPEGEAGLSKLQKPLPGPIASFDARWPLELDTWPGLEAQLAALADDIAYLNHDLDDGLRAGLLTIAQLGEAPLAGAHVKGVIAAHGSNLELSRFIGELIRTLMSALMEDVLAVTRANLENGAFTDAAALRGAGRATAQFSPALSGQLKALKSFQVEHIYHHPLVTRSMDGARRVVGELFAAFSADPALLPPDWAKTCGAPRDAATGSVVRDYIAGMTDRYALAEYRRIFRRDIDV